jgi:multiple sugar transport system substrate-binding protein
MHRVSRRLCRAVAAAGAAGLLVLAGACDALGSGADQSVSCDPAKPGEKVTLTFTSWVPGMEKTVDLWNQQNPDIQVRYKQVVPGPQGTYQAYANQIKGGDTPDLGMIEFDSLPSFRLQGGIMNIGGCPGVAEASARYLPWTMQQVAFGEPGAVYGVPQDVGPLALYYRKDLFQQNGIPVPTTWDEYYEAAKQIKAKGGLIVNFAPDAASFFAGLAWQGGGRWFSYTDTGWALAMTDNNTMRVAQYWQRMLNEKLVDSKPTLSNIQLKALDTGQEWSMIGAAWTAKLLENGAPDTTGKWAVAPLPNWQPDRRVSGNWGGSTTVVFKGTKHPAEAAKFALWAFGNLDAEALNNKNGGQFPATISGETDLPALRQPYPYFGGQVIWKIFQDAASTVDKSWQWGPTMTQTYTDLNDGLSAAVNGQGTIADAVRQAQSSTIATMKALALNVG